VIFGSSRGSRSSSRNTSIFTSRNSSILIFTTLELFVGTIPIWSGRGIGYYSSRGDRGGGGGGGIMRGRIVGGNRRGIVSRGYRRLFSIRVIKANRISPFTRSTSILSISSYIYIYSSFSLIIANKI